MKLESIKLSSIFVIPALLGALLLSACGEKEAEVSNATEEATQAAGEAVKDAATESAATVTEAAPAATESGGYVPTPEERVPGVTRPVDAAPAAEASPAETPTEAAPVN